MNDIEKAMAKLKGQGANGSEPSQKSLKNNDSPDASDSARVKWTDVDIDIGAIDSDCASDVLTSGSSYSVSTRPVSNDANFTPWSKDTQNHLHDTFKLSRTHVLPLVALGKVGYITPETPKCKLTEEYRRVKRPLLKRLACSNDNGETARNVIAVTSAMSGEGKTFSAINLAMSLAREKDRTVLLIDADVVRHTAGMLFGVSSDELGLLDLLDNDAIKPSDVIMKTNVQRLNFLPAGRKHSHASELLSSDSMSRLIADLSSRYDERIIVLDCPPIMQTNEAAILVDHAGQIVFVVAEEQTSQGLVIQALQLIGNEKKVGILLNKSTTRLGHYDHYSYAYS